MIVMRMWWRKQKKIKLTLGLSPCPHQDTQSVLPTSMLYVMRIMGDSQLSFIEFFNWENSEGSRWRNAERLDKKRNYGLQAAKSAIYFLLSLFCILTLLSRRRQRATPEFQQRMSAQLDGLQKIVLRLQLPIAIQRPSGQSYIAEPLNRVGELDMIFESTSSKNQPPVQFIRSKSLADIGKEVRHSLGKLTQSLPFEMVGPR